MCTQLESIIKEKRGRAKLFLCLRLRVGGKRMKLMCFNRHNPQGHLSLISVCFFINIVLIVPYSLETHNVRQLLCFLQGRVLFYDL